MADYVIVALFGLGIGLGELVSRYRDAPLRAVGSAPALLYMVVNACAALGALALIRVFEVDFGIGVEKVEQVRWTQLFVAGFASMALFRSSLFTVRVGDQDIGIVSDRCNEAIPDGEGALMDRRVLPHFGALHDQEAVTVIGMVTGRKATRARSVTAGSPAPSMAITTTSGSAPPS